jgi:hypothetical protein
MTRTEAITASGPCHNRKTYVPRSPYRSGLRRFSVHLLLKPQHLLPRKRKQRRLLRNRSFSQHQLERREVEYYSAANRRGEGEGGVEKRSIAARYFPRFGALGKKASISVSEKIMSFQMQPESRAGHLLILTVSRFPETPRNGAVIAASSIPDAGVTWLYSVARENGTSV